MAAVRLDELSAVVIPFMPDILQRALTAKVPGVIYLNAGIVSAGKCRFALFSFGCTDRLGCSGNTTPAAGRAVIEKMEKSCSSGDPWACGWAGYLSYDAAHWFDDAVAPAESLPGELLRFIFLDACYVIDRVACTAEVLFSSRASSERRRAFTTQVEALIHVEVAPGEAFQNLLIDDDLAGAGEMTRRQYTQHVCAVQQDIAAGDYYELNFTQRFRVKAHTVPQHVALHLLATHEPTYAAMFDFGNEVVISASPELFLRVDGTTVVTRPIKGTIQRGRELEADATAAATLRSDPKELAEHTMVVDLARNDLGRVCEPGTVRVTELYAIESHPAIHHMVSSIEGTLKAGVGLFDTLCATFPAASITGAPKIKVMQAISTYEASRRSVYTGAIGLIRHNGVDLSVAIRTITASANAEESWTYTFGSGGAVVADSDPDQEYEECLLKARSLYSSITRIHKNTE